MSASAFTGRSAFLGLYVVLVPLRLIASADDVHPVPKSFRGVLVESTRSQMRAVATYIAEYPEAGDSDEARLWLFDTAMTRGLQEEATKTAEQYLATEARDADIARAARMIRAISRVRSSDFADAISDFRDVVNGTRLRSPESTIVFAERLAVELQLAGHVALAEEVFDDLARRFSILPELRRRMENRLDKLGLVGEAPPALGLKSLDGEAIDLAAMKGKVVVVDFWATNCRPCLEMLPLLRRLHARHGENGLVVVGVSLDDGPEVVRPFATREKMTWSLAMDDGEASNAYHVRTIPSLFVVGRNGRVVCVDVRDESLERAVVKLVSEDGETESP